MTRKRSRTVLLVLAALAILGYSAPSRAQAALLMEEPYGFFGIINPTGHTAVYLARICADTPVKLRRCEPGEFGAVIARYQGISSYDWVAMPLIPYLYSVENVSEIPERVDRGAVIRLRTHYHEQHLANLDAKEGNLIHGGWDQLVGAAYERRIYAFRFATTPEQDDALISRFNDHANRSHFNLIYNNCADFSRKVMNTYFPHTFKRNLFPDAGMTTPRQIAFKLVRYAKKHPETELKVYEIPQITGYRHQSGVNKSVAGSLIFTGYVVPIALMNPYLAGGIFVDYLIRGRFSTLLEHPALLGPGQLSELSGTELLGENAPSADLQGDSVPGVARQQFPLPLAVPAMKTAMEPHE